MILTEWTGKAYGVNRRLEKGAHGNFYKSDGYRGFQDGLTWQLVDAQIRAGGGIRGDVQVRLEFTIDALRDVDSLIKPVLDCLERAECIENDRRVMRVVATKHKRPRKAPDVIRVCVEEWRER